jgi:hypothetical protein
MFLLLAHHSSAVFRRGSHCCHPYTSGLRGVGTQWPQINNNLWLRSTAHLRKLSHVSLDRHRQSCEERAVRTCSSRVKWLQISYAILSALEALLNRAIWCYSQWTKIDSFREFCGVLLLRLYSCSKLLKWASDALLYVVWVRTLYWFCSPGCLQFVFLSEIYYMWLLISY